MSDRDYEEFASRLIRVGSAVALQESGLVAQSSDAEGIARELEPLWESPRAQVIETRVNGTRIDVRVQADDGRAWLVVLWVREPLSTVLVAVTVYERPEAFRGTPSGRVVVLNGPSSVGKSSLMAAFADAAPTPWACIDEPMFGRFANRFLAWPETAGPVVDGFLAGLGASARAGNQLIVSTGGIAQDRFRAALVGVPTVFVGLDAPLAVLLERQVQQADKFGGLAEGSVGIHEGWVYDLRIDTATHAPVDAARLLAEFVENAMIVTAPTTELLTAAQRAAVIDVCVVAHDMNEFENLFTFIPSGGRHVLTYCGPELVSHAVVTTRWLQPEGHRLLKTAYVDAVSTLPQHQGQGYGSATMNRLAEEMGDYDIACLQTDKAEFYERLGWEVWRGPLAGRAEQGLIPTPDQRGVMVLRLSQTPALDLDAALSIECQPHRIWE